MIKLVLSPYWACKMIHKRITIEDYIMGRPTGKRGQGKILPDRLNLGRLFIWLEIVACKELCKIVDAELSTSQPTVVGARVVGRNNYLAPSAHNPYNPPPAPPCTQKAPLCKSE